MTSAAFASTLIEFHFELQPDRFGDVKSGDDDDEKMRRARDDRVTLTSLQRIRNDEDGARVGWPTELVAGWLNTGACRIQLNSSHTHTLRTNLKLVSRAFTLGGTILYNT